MTKKKKNSILVIHGPNLHLLGKREVSIYGEESLKSINAALKKKAEELNLSINIFQSNHEGEIVSKITEEEYDILIINPAAYTHTSVAIRDAILAVNKPAIEVHLSNIYKREDFRRKSLISDVSYGVISGFGKNSYLLALAAAKEILS